MVGHPTEQEFKGMVYSNMIKNCPITTEAIGNAYKIVGPNLAGLRGKTMREKLERVITEYVEIPRDFYILHKFVTISVDMMCSNGVPFLVSVSCNIKLITTEHIPYSTAKQLSHSITQILQLYSLGGFVVQTILIWITNSRKRGVIWKVKLPSTPQQPRNMCPKCGMMHPSDKGDGEGPNEHPTIQDPT